MLRPRTPSESSFQMVLTCQKDPELLHSNIVPLTRIFPTGTAFDAVANVRSVGACQHLCRLNPTCTHFEYYLPAHSVAHGKRCAFHSAAGTEQAGTNIAVGPQDCRGGLEFVQNPEGFSASALCFVSLQTSNFLTTGNTGLGGPWKNAHLDIR